MSRIILESQEECKFVESGSHSTGHDCWGNIEHSSYSYVYHNREIHHTYPGMYVIHDGEKVLGTGYVDHLPTSIRPHMDPNYFKTEKERRRKLYQELKKEFEKNPE